MYILFTILLFAVCIAVGLRVGSFETSYQTIWQALTNYNPSQPEHLAIVELRLPRLLLAFAVGASLALAGYLMQALINNSLADPFILGSAAGASLGANIAYFGIVPFYILGIHSPPLMAFAGCLLVTLAVVALGYRQGQLIPSQLLLAGIALNALLGALVSLLTYLSETEGKLRAIVFWTMGGFERAAWDNIAYPFVAVTLALILFVFLQKRLDLLLMGAARAEALGVNARSTRWLVLVSASVITGFAVALSGPIGFVGLIVPHVVRALLGVTGRLNMLFCSLLGGVFLMGCDLLARVLYPPAGLPVGIITSLFGVPFFIYLLSQKTYRFHS